MLNWKAITEFFVEYFKTKPFSDLLMIVLIGVFVWNESGHGDRTNEAHRVLAQILQERDANEQLRTDANERNTDRIITALTGVKTEVKKIPAAAAVAAKKLIESNSNATAPSEDEQR